MSFLPASVEAYLSMECIQGVMDVIVPGLPQPLPAAYYQAVDKDGMQWGTDLTVGQRQLAPMVPSDAPSPKVDKQPLDQRQFKMLTPKFHDVLNPAQLMQLRALGATQQDTMAKKWVARTVKDNLQRLENTRIACVHRVLCGSGILYVDKDGNLLSSSSGAVVTINQAPPTVNTLRGKLIDGSTNIIGTSWDNTAATIPADVQLILKTAVQRTGYKPTTAIYGPNIPFYLMGNTAIKGLFPGVVQALATAFAMGAIPDGFLGIQKWIPGAEAFWIDHTGYYAGQNPTTDEYAAAMHSEVGNDSLVLLPDANAGFYELAQGQMPVPVSNDILGATEDVIQAGFVLTQGKYGYAYITKDPVGVKLVYGDTFLPAIPVLGARWNLTVKF